MIILKNSGKNKSSRKVRKVKFNLELVDSDWILTIRFFFIFFQINISKSLKNCKQ